MIDPETTQFPLDLPCVLGCRAHVLGFYGGRLVGFTYHPSKDDPKSEPFPMIGAHDWALNGASMAKGERGSCLDLVLDVQGTVDELKGRVTDLEALLAANPDAPAEWTAPDRKTIADLKSQIAQLERNAS